MGTGSIQHSHAPSRYFSSASGGGVPLWGVEGAIPKMAARFSIIEPFWIENTRVAVAICLAASSRLPWERARILSSTQITACEPKTASVKVDQIHV